MTEGPSTDPETPAPTEEQMASPVWRICNIYTIVNKKGLAVPFKPSKQQRKVLKAYYVDGWTKLFIPKARQLGMSTLVAIMILDSVLFGSGIKCAICDFVAPNAKDKLENKIIYAFNALPEAFRNGWEVVNHNSNEGRWVIKKAGADSDDQSTVLAGGKPRGGTYQILHLSELGETMVKRPEEAREIFEGARPTATESLVIIETTWPGGRVGLLYPMVNRSITTPDHKKDKTRDYKTLFFPWFYDKTYVNNGDPSQITPETREYFSKLQLEVSDHVFTDPQMLWYQAEREDWGHRMYAIYPSRLEEIFLAPIDGSVYAQEIDEARVSGRVGSIGYNDNFPVHTVWDFGSPKNTIVLYFQLINGMYHIIDADVEMKKAKSGGDDNEGEINGLDLTLPVRVKHMLAKGYKFGHHYMPHDAGSRDIKFRSSWANDLRELGLPGTITIVNRTDDPLRGVIRMKNMFKSIHFSPLCKHYLDGLAAYRYREDPSNPKKFTNQLVHDFASHLADALRVLAEAELGHYIAADSPMNTNLVLDQIRLGEVTKKAITSKPDVGEIANGKSRTFKAEPSGWMMRWESPQPGMEYLVVLHNNCVQTWRAPLLSGQGKHRARLVAATAEVGRIDDDVAVDWACAMSHHYGDCIIIPTINNRESIIREIAENGCWTYSRTVKDTNRPIGRQKPPRKPGLDLDPESREAFISTLVKMFRDDRFIIEDPLWMNQASTFVLLNDGTRKAMNEYTAEKIEASAIALHLIGYATEYQLGGRDPDEVDDDDEEGLTTMG